MKNTEYRFIRVKKSHLNLLISLLDDVFQIKNKDKKALITWKYYSSYLENGIFEYGAFTKTNGVLKMVSHYCGLPVRITDGKNNYRSTICVDMATHPKHRGRGLISTLSKLTYKDVSNKKIRFSIGFSNEEGVKVDIHSKGYGYQLVGKFKSYSCVLTKKKKTESELQKISEFRSNFKYGQDGFFSLSKSRDYLNWRYKENPNNLFSFYEILAGGKFAGYVVLKNSGIKIHVIDIVTKFSVKNIKDVIKSINNLAIDNGKRLVTYSVLDNKLWRQVFSKSLTFGRNSKKNSYYLTVKIHDNFSKSPDLLDRETWLCFVGDIL